MTIYNGGCVQERTFIPVPPPGVCRGYDVFTRDCTRSPWRLMGTYSSQRAAEDTARALWIRRVLAEVRPHR
jgi:hypothetical protein